MIPHSYSSTTPDAISWQGRIPKANSDYFQKLCLGTGYRQAIVERLVLQLEAKLRDAKAHDEVDVSKVESLITELTEIQVAPVKAKTKPKV